MIFDIAYGVVICMLIQGVTLSHTIHHCRVCGLPSVIFWWGLLYGDLHYFFHCVGLLLIAMLSWYALVPIVVWWWIWRALPSTGGDNATDPLSYFLHTQGAVPEPTVEQTMETPVIWNAIVLMTMSLWSSIPRSPSLHLCDVINICALHLSKLSRDTLQIELLSPSPWTTLIKMINNKWQFKHPCS